MPFTRENWLSLDLGSREATLAIHRVEPDQVPLLLREVSLGEGPHHSERLIPCLEAALRDSSLSVDKLDRFLTSFGPGSFTGLRIAFASLKALAMVSTKPIELVSGSEARALAWSGHESVPIPGNIGVISHVALDKYALARFSVTSHGEVTRLEEKIAIDRELLAHPPGIWLIDAKTPREKLDGIVHLFPLRARHLAEALPNARSRRSLTRLEDWIAAEPLYFGDTKY